MKKYELVVFVNNSKRGKSSFLYEVYPQGIKRKGFHGFNELYTLDLSCDEKLLLQKAYKLNRAGIYEGYAEKISNIVIIEQKKRLGETYVKN